MPTYYVEDYEALTGNKAVDTSETEAKVVEPEAETPAPKKTSRAKTKG